MTQKSTLIIGGGLAGLTAAAHLAERGLNPIVLEANQSWPGGRLAGGEPVVFEHDGQTWHFPSEHGIHGLWGGYANMRATLDRFIDDDTLAPQPSGGEAWINRWGDVVRSVEAGSAVRGRHLPAPFHYLNLLVRPRFWGAITLLDFLSLPGYLFSLAWTVGFDPIAEKRALDGLTMNDYFRGWTPNLRATIEGVARNMLAAPDEAITLTGTIAALRFYTMLRRDTWNPYFFPANSHTAVIAPLAEVIEARGGRVLLGVTARDLCREGDGWRVGATRYDGAGFSLSAENVVLAGHASAMQTLLGARAADVRFPSTLRNAVVRLWYTAQPTQRTPSGMFTGDFTADNFFWLDRIHQEFATWAAAGGSAIEVHIYGDDALLDQPDNHILAAAIDDVARAWPGLRAAYIHGTVRRNSKTHTAFRVPTDDSLHVDTAWPGIFAAGDWIGYDHPSLWMERACTTGIAAANGVLAVHNLEPFSVLQPPPPERSARMLATIVRALRASVGRGLLAVLRGVRRKGVSVR